jgi:hypothetical protein
VTGAAGGRSYDLPTGGGRVPGGVPVHTAAQEGRGACAVVAGDKELATTTAYPARGRSEPSLAPSRGTPGHTLI